MYIYYIHINLKITKQKLILFFAAFTLLTAFSGCSKEDDTPLPESRNIKYEITGTYSGRLTVVYADEGGNNQTINVNSLPWSKSVTIDNDVLAVALAAGNSGVDSPGAMGEIITLKIYRNGQVVEESTATATDNGFIELGLSYSFGL